MSRSLSRGLACASALALLVLACEESAPRAPAAASAPASTDAARAADATPRDADEPAPEVDALADFALTPPTPRLARLTRLQYRNAVADLFGADVTPPSALEPDTQADGLFSVGASVSSLSPRGVEQAIDAARGLARELTAAPARRARLFGCEAADDACVSSAVDAWGPRIWRRPLTSDERSELQALGAQASAALGGPAAGLEAVLARLLQSPHFLYRVELGEADPDRPGERRLSAHELAARLAAFLWNSVPDDALRAAANSGALLTPAGLDAELTRMMAAPRLRDAVRNFFAEWLDLYALDALNKDPNLFRHASAELGAAAREETLRLAELVVFERDADVRELLTSRTTFIDRRLAAIYNVPATADEGFGRVELPADGPRAGFLGQVAFLAHNAHPTSTSATLRGIFVRERLLCQSMPPPPTNLNTAIPEPTEAARTLKERLLRHMEDDFCAGCHAMTDPIGFGFEQFDGIGRWRLEENGALIDASGTLDAVPFEDAAALTRVIADHPALAGCVTRTLFAYATGGTPRGGQQAQLDALTEQFEARGLRLLPLMRAVARSPGFRRVAPIDPAEGGAP